MFLLSGISLCDSTGQLRQGAAQEFRQHRRSPGRRQQHRVEALLLDAVRFAGSRLQQSFGQTRFESAALLAGQGAGEMDSSSAGASVGGVGANGVSVTFRVCFKQFIFISFAKRIRYFSYCCTYFSDLVSYLTYYLPCSLCYEFDY